VNGTAGEKLSVGVCVCVRVCSITGDGTDDNHYTETSDDQFYSPTVVDMLMKLNGRKKHFATRQHRKITTLKLLSFIVIFIYYYHFSLFVNGLLLTGHVLRKYV